MPAGTWPVRWPGYNRKVAACTPAHAAPWALSSAHHLQHCTCTSGGLSHPLRLRAALPRHRLIPGGLVVSCIRLRFRSVSSQTPLLCLPPARTAQQTPLPSRVIQHTDANLFSALAPICRVYAWGFTHPGLSPVQPFPPPFFAGTTRLPAARHPSQYLPPCCAATLSLQRTGRSNIDLPPGT